MGADSGRKSPAGVIGWVSKVVYILFSFEFGFLLMCLPWMDIWEDNYLLYQYPQIRPIVENAFFKGFVLGLGIVNILIGIDEILHIKDRKGFFSS